MKSVYNNPTFKIKINAIRLVLLFSVLIVIIKFIAWYVSKSNAILSDALESVINIATSGFTLYSLYYSAKKKDDDHPYGHGKIEYFSVGFEGALILGTGLLIFAYSIYHLFHPKPLQNIDGGILLTIISGIAMYFIGSFLKQKGNELNSAPLLADGTHFHLDALTSAALIAGLFIYKIFGWIWIDPVLAMILAIQIVRSGIKLMTESVNHLLDKADVASISKVVDSLEKYRNKCRIDIHNLRLQKFGENLHVDCHMTMPFYYTLDQVHDEIKLLEKEMNADFNDSIELFIHTDPCQQIPCDLCKMSECTFRKKQFIHEVKWTPENLMRNKKHQLM